MNPHERIYQKRYPEISSNVFMNHIEYLFKLLGAQKGQKDQNIYLIECQGCEIYFPGS